jgi:hypothetical protein
MFTCFIRYQLDPNKLDDFREYARSWISLIRKYGGTHHGYFIPGSEYDSLPSAAFSFPDLGTEGPPNIAVALFSFPSIEAYDRYRLAVSDSCVRQVLQIDPGIGREVLLYQSRP